MTSLAPTEPATTLGWARILSPIFCFVQGEIALRDRDRDEATEPIDLDDRPSVVLQREKNAAGVETYVADHDSISGRKSRRFRFAFERKRPVVDGEIEKLVDDRRINFSDLVAVSDEPEDAENGSDLLERGSGSDEDVAREGGNSAVDDPSSDYDPSPYSEGQDVYAYG